MTRSLFFFIALLAFAVRLTAACPGECLAMGTKSGFEQIQKDKTQKEQTEKSADEKKDRGKELRKDRTGGEEEKSTPEQKPRLKYRDPYECGC